MNQFKLRVNDMVGIDITPDDYERATGMRRPWVKRNADGSMTYRAVCPKCENPIVIVNLNQRSGTRQPRYGRHHPHSIPNLADYDQQAYDRCPLTAPRSFNRADKRPEGDQKSIRILAQLIAQFDRVVYLLEKAIGMDLSESIARKMLETYRGEQGHRYLHAHHLNIPWVFAYMGTRQSLNLYKRRLFDNDPLKDAINHKISGAEWRGDRLEGRVVDGQKTFLDLTFGFIEHGSSRRDGDTVERIRFQVSTTRYGRPVEVYKQTLWIEDSRWSALITKPRNEYAQKQADRWIPIAREILDPTGALVDTISEAERNRAAW